MHASRLQSTHYETSQGPCTESTVELPGWSEIENAIKKLDRDLFPFVWIYFDPRSRPDDVPDVEVVGGRSAYTIRILNEGAFHSYFDPRQSDEEVWVWESDQGAAVPRNQTCGDLALVLEIVKEACENNRLLRGINWIEEPA